MQTIKGVNVACQPRWMKTSRNESLLMEIRSDLWSLGLDRLRPTSRTLRKNADFCCHKNSTEQSKFRSAKHDTVFCRFSSHHSVIIAFRKHSIIFNPQVVKILRRSNTTLKPPSTWKQVRFLSTLPFSSSSFQLQPSAEHWDRNIVSHKKIRTSLMLPFRRWVPQLNSCRPLLTLFHWRITPVRRYRRHRTQQQPCTTVHRQSSQHASLHLRHRHLFHRIHSISSSNQRSPLLRLMLPSSVSPPHLRRGLLLGWRLTHSRTRHLDQPSNRSRRDTPSLSCTSQQAERTGQRS